MSIVVLSKSTQRWWTDWNPSVGLSNLTQRWRESENLTVVMPYLAQRRPKNGNSTVVLPTLILRWFNIVKLTPTYNRPFQPFTDVGSTSPCRPTVYFEITVIIMLNINWIHVKPLPQDVFQTIFICYRLTWLPSTHPGCFRLYHEYYMSSSQNKPPIFTSWWHSFFTQNPICIYYKWMYGILTYTFNIFCSVCILVM